MKTVIFAAAMFLVGTTAASAGNSAYGGNFPILPKPQTGTITVTPQVNGPVHFPRYPTGPLRDDNGGTIVDGEHSGLGDRTFQPCTFCGGVGR